MVVVEISGGRVKDDEVVLLFLFLVDEEEEIDRQRERSDGEVWVIRASGGRRS